NGKIEFSLLFPSDSLEFDLQLSTRYSWSCLPSNLKKSPIICISSVVQQSWLHLDVIWPFTACLFGIGADSRLLRDLNTWSKKAFPISIHSLYLLKPSIGNPNFGQK